MVIFSESAQGYRKNEKLVHYPLRLTYFVKENCHLRGKARLQDDKRMTVNILHLKQKEKELGKNNNYESTTVSNKMILVTAIFSGMLTANSLYFALLRLALSFDFSRHIINESEIKVSCLSKFTCKFSRPFLTKSLRRLLFLFCVLIGYFIV